MAATQRPDGGSRPGHDAAISPPRPAVTPRELQWPSGGAGPELARELPGPRRGNAGWSVFSYLISGMAVYGAIGWIIGRWTHLAFLFPVGMLTGLILAIVLIIYRLRQALITVRQAGAAARPGDSRAAAAAVRKVAAVHKVKACAAACHPTDIRVPCRGRPTQARGWRRPLWPVTFRRLPGADAIFSRSRAAVSRRRRPAQLHISADLHDRRRPLHQADAACADLRRARGRVLLGGVPPSRSWCRGARRTWASSESCSSATRSCGR